jgi:hypothetical protein
MRDHYTKKNDETYCIITSFYCYAAAYQVAVHVQYRRAVYEWSEFPNGRDRISLLPVHKPNDCIDDRLL